jgi:hypothetical protein
MARRVHHDFSGRGDEEATRIEERRAKIAQLLREGVSGNRTLAMRIGLEGGKKDEMLVIRDKQAIWKLWRQEAMQDVEKVRAREIAVLEQVAAEFWKAWNQSWRQKVTMEAVIKATKKKRDKFKKDRANAELVPLPGEEQEETSPGGVVEIDGELYKVTPTKRKEEERDPNPAFLKGVIEAHQKICELRGLLTRENQAGMGGAPQIIGIEVVMPREIALQQLTDTTTQVEVTKVEPEEPADSAVI